MMQKNSKINLSDAMRSEPLCENLSFANAEANKLLRTNIMFSLPDEEGCKVIGITSSVMGEGKSVTSINLAYSFAQTGKNVLLLEADMRRPNIAKRLGLKSKPGLSNFLAGLSSEVIQSAGEQRGFYVITAGDVPPNPAELLGSAKMQNCIDILAEKFDYIIVDLPPITVVSDALALTKLVDGFVFVVRQNYVTKQAVRDAMYQLKIVDAKLLGFVTTCAASKDKSYRYGKGKNYGYGSYETAGKAKK